MFTSFETRFIGDSTKFFLSKKISVKSIRPTGFYEKYKSYAKIAKFCDLLLWWIELSHAESCPRTALSQVESCPGQR